MENDKLEYTRNVMLRTDQVEALRMISAATGKSMNDTLVSILRDLIKEEESNEGQQV